MSMTTTYSPDDNKLRLYSSMRLDSETYKRVHAAGFIWAPKQELFVAPMWTPDREDLLIELCGEIEDEDKSLVERAEERADRFEDYSENRAKDADNARKGVSAIADNIPLGQPILVGHHSERHARKDAERIENGMRKAVKMWEQSQYWQSRAKGAIRHAKYKEHPDVRARRIKGIEAGKRKTERSKAEAEKHLAFWSRENLTHEQALFFAGHSSGGWLHLPRKEGDRPDFNQSPDAYSALSNSYPNLYAPRTVEEVVQAAKGAYPRQIERCNRWLTHYENRLGYEKAMLEEQGGSALIAPKPRPTQLPLCNYRQESFQIENNYHRGEFLKYRQVEMIQAEYTKMYHDYKGTHVIDNSHRVRTAVIKHEHVAVFLTDSKVHKKPDPVEPPPPRRRDPIPVRTYVAPEPTPFDAMTEQLKEGVQVVVANQLFPTPPELAERMVDYAVIEPGQRILEPSAGTGVILGAMGGAMWDEPSTEPYKDRDQLYAVEINSNLAERLRTQFPLTHVRCADFLECNGDMGQFDRIVMNPPFVNGADIKHIEHALTMLKPGGRLVAICANGSRQNEKLKPLADTWEELPAGTFKEQGTGVNTVLLTINK